MPLKTRFLALFLAAILGISLTLAPVRLLAEEEQDPNISDILITTSGTHLLLFSSVKNGFTEEMLQGVKNGIPITFTFFLQLEKVKHHWFNSTIAEQTVSHTMSYDNLKEKFTITLSERPRQPEVTDSETKAKEIMTELNGIKVIALNDLVPDSQYVLHIKATLAEKTLPLKLHYILPFVSLWDFETDWRSVEFKY